MITEDGKILHIDFGCAFGQKTKLEKLLGLFMDIPYSPFSEDVFIGKIFNQTKIKLFCFFVDSDDRS
jgi:hypothetical protein